MLTFISIAILGLVLGIITGLSNSTKALMIVAFVPSALIGYLFSIGSIALKDSIYYLVLFLFGMLFGHILGSMRHA